MTKADKIVLTQFIALTGMYIHPVDMHNIQSFINGYETGRKDWCHFTDLSKELLAKKYKIAYSSSGLPGQIKEFSEKRSLYDVVVFKKIALEVIALENTDTKAVKFFTSRILALIKQIPEAGFRSTNETWRNQWLSLISVKQQWFIQLWNKKELAVLKLIDKEVLSGNIYKDQQSRTPSERILLLSKKFEEAVNH